MRRQVWRRPILAAPASERQLLALIVLIATAVYAFAARMRVRKGVPSGDEPAYLLISKTLAKYHSLDVMRSYRNEDYRSFYPGLLDAHVVHGAHGHLQPLHQIGGPLLWLIPFMVWGRGGAVGFTVVVSVLTLVNIYFILRERRIEARYAFVATLAVAIGSPIYVLSAMNFVEPIGTLAIIFAVRALLMPKLSGTRLTIASIGVALAPWVHMRFAPTSLILGILLVIRVWRDHRSRSWQPYAQALAPPVLSVILIEIYTIALYGSINPMAPQSIYGISVFDVPFGHSFAGTLYDRNVGLMTNFPLFLLVLPGIMLALRREYLRTQMVIAAVAIPYLIMSCTSTTWWGAFTPPARYVSVLVPLLTFYIAVVVQRIDRWYATGAAVLLGAVGYAMAIGSDIVPGDRFTAERGPNRGMLHFDQLTGFDLMGHLPSSFKPDQGRLFFGCIAVTVAIGGLFWFAGSWPTLRRGILRTPPPADAPHRLDGPPGGASEQLAEDAAHGAAASSGRLSSPC
jgi:hypothetical protein